MAEFKDKKTVLIVRGIGEVTSNNLTDDLKARLLAISSDYKKYFKTTKSKKDVIDKN